ncbi:MAG TPA: CHASE domain-containing protein, partial [Candidatus Paceibacterota bacterium]|nr:CHASE domain-containing protein [Candidatus Paceibacterota bacterium]
MNSPQTSLFQECRRWIPATVLLAGLALTVSATYYAAWSVKLRNRSDFEIRAEQTRASIDARLENYVSMLRGMAGYFAAETNVTRQGFADYVSRMHVETAYPGIQGVGFSIRIPRAEEPALKERLEREGVKDFHVWPPSDSAEEHAIIYLVPEDPRNLAAVGYDMFTESSRREAMERARDTGRQAASAKVTLVQEIYTNKQTGFLIYMPVY